MSERSNTSPVGKAAIKVGIFSVALAAIFEIGCLGYYGSGLSSEPSALSNVKSGSWPVEVKSKIQSLYLYYFLSLYICVLAATIVYVDPNLCRIFGHPLMMIGDFFVQSIVQGGKAFKGLGDEGILSAQKIAWTAYCSFVGAKASPSLVFGVDCARFAVHMTCLIIFALIALSLTAPVEKYFNWKGILNQCEMAIFISSIGTAFCPVWTTMGAIFFSINFYGGLILYPINFLRHAQEAQMVASEENGENDFCAVAMVVPMILDVISIFSRVVVLVPPA